VRITNESAPKKAKNKGFLVIIAVLAIFALLFVDSKYRLVTTKYELFYDNLPQSFDGYKVVQLSDLHMEEYGENNERLVEEVTKNKPDIIVFTGDVINMSGKKTVDNQSEKLRPFLEDLSKIAPCYFISGNHEWASGELNTFVELLEDLNILYLRNEHVLLERNNESIVLAGVEDPNGPADMITPDVFVENINNEYPEKFKMMLGHRNDWLQKYPDIPVDLILCGHAHGGVVRIPFVGGVFGTGMELFPKYDAGAYNEGNYDMIISRGLGGNTPMPRFLNNPEIVLVVLRKA